MKPGDKLFNVWNDRIEVYTFLSKDEDGLMKLKTERGGNAYYYQSNLPSVTPKEAWEQYAREIEGKIQLIEESISEWQKALAQAQQKLAGANRKISAYE